MKKFVSFALAIALVCTLAAAMAGAAFAADKADMARLRNTEAAPRVWRGAAFCSLAFQGQMPRL